MESTIAITGASGSLGRVLVDRLVRDPRVERVVALDRRAPTLRHHKVHHVDCDVRDEDLAEHLAGCGALVHLAFIVEKGSRDQALVQSVNVDGTANVAESAARAGVRHIVYASSIAAYGFRAENANGPLTEDAPTRGNDDFYYARTKAECERLFDDFERRHPDVGVARLRPSIFLGPRGHRGIDQFRKRVFPYPSRSNALPVHVTHEDDVAEAFFLALDKGATGAFNIATDEPLPVRDWSRAMGKPGVPIPGAVVSLADLAYRFQLIDVDPVWFRAGSEFPIVVSSKRARRVLKWRPRYATTGAVLRALAGAPTAAASRGTKLLFGGGAFVTRLRGGLPVGGREAAEMRGMNGTVNLELTGDHPSEWRVEFRDGSAGIYRGGHPDAKATITLKESVLTDMLSGKLKYTNAMMTGKVRIRGDGNYNFLLGGIVGGFRKALGGRAPARAFAHLVLKGNGASAQLGG